MLCFLSESSKNEKRDAFSHEWTEYPSSLFDVIAKCEEKYVMRKGNKSDFLSYLKCDIAHITEEELLPESSLPSAYFVDAMAFLQRFQSMEKNCFWRTIKSIFAETVKNDTYRLLCHSLHW